METGYDILPWWVARMIMIGYFATKKPPFKNVVLHGLVRDKYGQKMSKSKGNVINPMRMVERYGADALRLALLFETTLGADISLSEERVVGMRNFVNKVWNIGRYLYLNCKLQITDDKLNDKLQKQNSKFQMTNSKRRESDSYESVQYKMVILVNLIEEFKQEEKKYFQLMKTYRFSQALSLIYKFLWHRLADFYIEESKQLGENDKIIFLGKLREVYWENLKMLHPFAPFVTEAIWKLFFGEKETIMKTTL